MRSSPNPQTLGRRLLGGATTASLGAAQDCLASARAGQSETLQSVSRAPLCPAGYPSVRRRALGAALGRLELHLGSRLPSAHPSLRARRYPRLLHKTAARQPTGQGNLPSAALPQRLRTACRPRPSRGRLPLNGPALGPLAAVSGLGAGVLLGLVCSVLAGLAPGRALWGGGVRFQRIGTPWAGVHLWPGL